MGMDIKQIQDLIKFVSKSGVNEVSIEEKDFKITIKTTQETTYVTAAAPVVAQIAPPVAAQSLAPVIPVMVPVAAEQTNYITVKSPMIGTFYRSSAPDYGKGPLKRQ